MSVAESSSAPEAPSGDRPEFAESIPEQSSWLSRLNRTEALTAVMVGVLLLLSALHAIANAGGPFTFALDDPYIHLALAENILHGHYGVNDSEVSAPSSSILYPLLAALGIVLGIPQLMLWLLNAIPLIICAVLVARVLREAFEPNSAWQEMVLSAFAFVLMLNANFVLVALSGMETGIQLAATAAWVLGTWRVARGESPSMLVVVCILLALVRFEGLAMALGASVYLALLRYYRQAGLIALTVGLVHGGHALFLSKLGLDPLPSSVMLKSVNAYAGVDDYGLLLKIIALNIVFSPRAHVFLWPLIGGLLLLMVSVKRTPGAARRELLPYALMFGLFFSICTLHFCAGVFSGFNARYELYAILIAVLTPFTLIPLSRSFGMLIATVAVSAGLWVSLPDYVYYATAAPAAARQIGQQQRLMHELVTVDYKHPVAINDLGLVSYQNPGYVLDLVGLANQEARRKFVVKDRRYLDDMTRVNNVHMAMIYDKWFEGMIPSQWLHVGYIHLLEEPITAAGRFVSIWATDPESVPEIREALLKLAQRHPGLVEVGPRAFSRDELLGAPDLPYRSGESKVEGPASEQGAIP